MRIKQLKQNRADKTAELRKISDTLKTENRAMTETERARVAQLEADLNGIDADIEFEERLQERERRQAPIVDENERTAAQQRASSVSVHDRAEDDPWGGFTDAADFGRSVRAACLPAAYIDPRLMATMARRGRGPQAAAPSNPHLEGGGSGGEGYEVPAALSERLFTLIFEEDDLVTAMDPEPTDSNAVDIEADETTPWGAAGVQAYWRGENTPMTGTKLATKYRTVRLHELYAFVSASDELLEDAPRLNNRLTVKSADAIRWKASEAVAFGTGAGQPLGFLNNSAGALVTVSKETSQTAGTIVTANVLKIYSRLILGGGRPFWFANQDILPQLAVMTIGNQPIYTPPNAGLKEAPGGFLLGLPIRYSEHAQTLGTKGDLTGVNPAGYYAAIKRGGVKFASSIHLYFDYNATAFRWTFRLGGQPYLSAPVSPAKGSNTKSHFVTVETRS